MEVVLLPNAARVRVPDAKVRDYLLSSSHPVGRFKAVFFLALGFSLERWEVLRDALLDIGTSGNALPGQASPSGRSSRFVLLWSDRLGDVRTSSPSGWYR